MTGSLPRVIIHHDADGVTSILSDVPVEVLEITEVAPDDRVYRRKVSAVGAEFIACLIGSSPIGHADDNSPAQRRTEALVNGGRPALSIVRSEP